MLEGAEGVTSRERVQEALAHREPDRVPVSFSAQRDLIPRLQEYLGVASRAELDTALGLDVRRLSLWWEGGPERLPGLWGKRTFRDVLDYDLKRIAAAPGRLTGEPDDPATGYDWAAFRQAAEQAQDCARFAGASSFIVRLSTELTAEGLLMNMALDPDSVRRQLREATEAFQAKHRLMLEAAPNGIDVYEVYDPYALLTGPIIGPRMFRDLLAPFLQEVADLFHIAGVLLQQQCRGQCELLVPEFIEAGVDVLYPLELCHLGTDAKAFKQRFGQDLVLHGGLDVLNVVRTGTAGEVRDEVDRLLDELAPGGGFILGPATEFTADTPPQNVIAVYEAAGTLNM